MAAAAASTTGIVSDILHQETIDVQHISNGGYAPKTLEAALYFTQSSTSFVNAINDSVAFAGLCNYCPVLVGAFAALKFGVQPVSDCPIDACLVDEVNKVFQQLWTASSGEDCSSKTK
jgi:ADP-ribosylglycohydrolase